MTDPAFASGLNGVIEIGHVRNDGERGHVAGPDNMSLGGLSRRVDAWMVDLQVVLQDITHLDRGIDDIGTATSDPCMTMLLGDDSVSLGWRIALQILGWGYFLAWSASFWPQVVLNYRRKS